MTTYAPGWTFIDKMGHFFIQSSREHKYIMICYVADCNAVLSKAIKNRMTQLLLVTCQNFYTILAKAWCAPQLHKWDNKTSTKVEDLITS